MLGPWPHSGLWNISPNYRKEEDFPFEDELLKFFDHYLKGNPTSIAREAQVYYYTMGEDAWKSARTWPPDHIEPYKLHLNSHGRLTYEPPQFDFTEVYQVDTTHTSSKLSRWEMMIEPWTDPKKAYADRSTQSLKTLAFESFPIGMPLEITGHPQVKLYLETQEPNAKLFVYLEHVAPNGKIHYITEGMLHLRHRRSQEYGLPYELVDQEIPRTYNCEDTLAVEPDVHMLVELDLLPTSYQVPMGHKIRLSIAGADAGHFPVNYAAPPVYTVSFGPQQQAELLLPTIPIPENKRDYFDDKDKIPGINW